MGRFKIGQKVVCVKTHSMGAVIKGKTYTVLKYDGCCGSLSVGIKDPLPFASVCYLCSNILDDDWYLCESIFAPIQEDGSTSQLTLEIEEFELETIEYN